MIEVTAGAILVAAKDVPAFLAAAQKELQDYFKGFFTEQEQITPTDEAYTEFYVDQYNDVGDSYVGRVAAMAKAIGPFLADAVTFRIRHETMSDDRDEYVPAGPTEDAIRRECEQTAITRALEALSMIPGKDLSDSLRIIEQQLTALLPDQPSTIDLHEPPTPNDA